MGREMGEAKVAWEMVLKVHRALLGFCSGVVGGWGRLIVGI